MPLQQLNAGTLDRARVVSEMQVVTRGSSSTGPHGMASPAPVLPPVLPPALGRCIRLQSTVGLDAGPALSRPAMDWLEGRCRFARVGVTSEGAMGDGGGVWLP